VIIENVPGVKRAKQSVVRKTTQLLHANGYEVRTGYFRADAMGWPQSRKRFFLIACRGWAPLKVEEVSASLGADPRPVSWALADFEGDRGDDVMMTGATLSVENQRRVDLLHERDIYDLPNEERPECHQNGTTYSAVYGRLRWDRPAPTITTGFLTPGRGRYVHPHLRRTLVPREAARLQGFPDSFAFSGGELPEPTRASLTKWIGDAVPVPLGYAAALAALAGRPRGS
jgi:DNA (cytosine-5)-methyltransferase 1